MPRYRITIPKKSLMGTLVVLISNGGKTAPVLTRPLEDSEMETTFEVGNDAYGPLPWVHDKKGKDTPYFDVLIEYTNKTGTRRETVRPVPEMVR